jgi:hypothetical protein
VRRDEGGPAVVTAAAAVAGGGGVGCWEVGGGGGCARVAFFPFAVVLAAVSLAAPADACRDCAAAARGGCVVEREG